MSRSRSALLVLLSTAVSHASGQLAVMAGCGLQDDHLVDRTDISGIAGIEFRTALLPAFGCRASASYSPWQSKSHEDWASSVDPTPRTWLAQNRKEAFSMFGATLELKLPFSDTSCVGGLYRGTYTTFGIGMNVYRTRTMVRNESEFGEVSLLDRRGSNTRLLLKAGFGGEWNTRWGCPFAELQVGLGGSRFAATIGAVVGYRYVFMRARDRGIPPTDPAG